jgi:hypothetical protein
MNGLRIAGLLANHERGDSLSTVELRELGEGLLEIMDFLSNSGSQTLASCYRQTVYQINGYLINRKVSPLKNI